MNIADAVSDQAGRAPDAPAIEVSGRSIDYRTLDTAVWRAAAAFRERGIAPGTIVAILLPDGPLHLAASLALARMGAVQLTLPPGEPRAYLSQQLQRFGVEVALGEADVDAAWLMPEAAGRIDTTLRAAGGDMPCKIVLTSGTTTRARGGSAVIQTHAMHAIGRAMFDHCQPMVAGDRYLAAVGLSFTVGWRICMECLARGATVVFPEPVQGGVAAAQMIGALRISYLMMVASHAHALVNSVASDAGCAWPAMRVIRLGGMVTEDALRRAVRQRLCPNLIISYGSNESWFPLTIADPACQDRFPASVGMPLPGVEIQIVDASDNPLPAGTIGRIRARAPGMPQRYYDDADKTARTFRHGWYYPGDLGRLAPEGALYYLGREDDMINFDGIKIYPVEIETILSSHAAVAEAAAFALPSPRHQQVPAAAVVLRSPVDLDELKSFARERMGNHAPQIVIEVNAIPKTAIGKVDKARLASDTADRLLQSNVGGDNLQRV